MAKRKRKLSAAHLAALRAGLARYRKRKASGNKTTTRRRKARKRPVTRTTTTTTTTVRNPWKKHRSPYGGTPPVYERAVHPRKRRRRLNPPPANKRVWWIFDKGNQHCQYGQGTRAEALKKARQIANKIGRKVGVWGPYESYAAAYDGCN